MKKTSSNHQNETNNSIKRSNINFYNVFKYKINMIKEISYLFEFQISIFWFYLC